MFGEIENSLFVQNVENVNIVSIAEARNDSFFLKIVDDQMADVTWFKDRPERKAGEIPFRRLARKKIWKNLFGSSEPNASLSWFDDDGQDHSLVFVMQKPKYDKLTGGYRIKSIPLNDQIIENKRIDRASLFIDASDPTRNTDEGSQSPGDGSTARKIGIIGGSVAGGIATVWGGYRLFSSIRATTQASAIKQREEILNQIDPLFRDEIDLMEAYRKKLYRSFADVDTFSDDPEGYNGLIDFMDSNEMGKNIVAAWTKDFEDVAKDYALNGANKEYFLQVIQDQVKESMRSATSLMVETYKQKGAEGIFDFYTRVMDVDEQELMNNPDLFADFTKVVKAENTQLASELVTSHRSLRTMMTV